MKRLPFLLLAALLAANAAFAKTTETDWCTIETPDAWPTDQPLPVTVTLKGEVPAGVMTACHLHWMKRDAFGGMLSWHPNRPASPGAKIVFNHRPRPAPDVLQQMASVDAVVFLAPDGDWNRKVKEAHVAVDTAAPLYPARPATCTFKKSALWVESITPEVPQYGDKVDIVVHYVLDPSDTWGDKPSEVLLNVVGPWIDNPDGVVNKNRHHEPAHGFGAQRRPVQPGEGTLTFTYTNRSQQDYVEALLILKFIDPMGDQWPWEFRSSMKVIPGTKTLRLVPTAPGGIWSDGETPEVSVVWSEKPPPGSFTGHLVVRDVAGNVRLERDIPLDPDPDVNAVIPLDGIAGVRGAHFRGCASVTLSIPNVAEAHTFIAVAPAFQRRPGIDTPFGATNIHDPDCAAIAAKLGFSFVRNFIPWKEIEPLRGRYLFDTTDHAVESAVSAGLKPWICLYSPPTWALPAGLHSAGFEPSPFDLGDWASVIDAVARRYGEKLWGFEWLNEIVPGSACKDPVHEYVDICRIGTEAAHKANPALSIQLAGGLWPHSYRIDLLNAGIAQYVDTLPVHYSDFGGIAEARRDLDVRGFTNVKVTDNESASGYSVWNMPADQALAGSRNQCKWVMTRWPDELCAGASAITYFGGHTQSAGNWTYLLDDHTPRPVAVTLALVQGALGYARPVGKFFLGNVAVHLFDRDGRGVAFVRAPDAEGVRVDLPAVEGCTVLDFQGEPVDATYAGGKVSFDAGDMPVLIEGADLDALTLEACLLVGGSSVPVAEPQVVAQAGDEIAVPVTVRNLYSDRRRFSIRGEAASWGAAEPVEATLDPGQSADLKLLYRVEPGTRPDPSTDLAAALTCNGRGQRPKAFRLTVVDPAALGNLLDNGGFEKPGAGDRADGWGGQGTRQSLPDPFDPDNHILVIPGTGNWVSSGQGVKLPVPGDRYLYTAWLWNDPGMDPGSNLVITDNAGRGRTLTKPNVFTSPVSGTKFWHFFAKVVDTETDTASISTVPVGRGPAGTVARYDNVSVTLYRGTDFVAQAPRAVRAPALDGDLSDWPAEGACKIPLLCENQLDARNGYAWTPENLSGVARLAWDDAGLYLAVAVEDDVLRTVPATSDDGAELLIGDSVVFALNPAPDSVEHASNQLRWYLSKAAPGGSGASTLFRPAAYALGAKSGQLARDSSVYEFAIRRDGTRTCYELKIPWSEIPGFAPAPGAAFGCRIQLFDSDTAGPALGSMLWGDGRITLMP